MEDTKHDVKSSTRTVLGGKPKFWDDAYWEDTSNEFLKEEREWCIKTFGDIFFKESPFERYAAWRVYTEMLNNKQIEPECPVIM